MSSTPTGRAANGRSPGGGPPTPPSGRSERSRSEGDVTATPLLVGIVARAHGLRGEVAVEVRTDSPDERFAPGARLDAWRPGTTAAVLTVASVRPHSGRLLVTFAEAPDRASAEALRGTRLTVDAGALPTIEDPDEFHVHQLEGLRAELASGEVVGTVREVVHGPGGELLVLARPDLPDALVPFVREIVPTVDLSDGRVVLDPPEGLLD
ncbi:ribosome maturation factor RimM [Pseudonocardia sp.]|uniref:ribosome maturation factor RimM n=1 Tax=Pseudonocardia sp. TaxID=60912 RepID=UPI003D0E94F9